MQWVCVLFCDVDDEVDSLHGTIGSHRKPAQYKTSIRLSQQRRIHTGLTSSAK